MGRRICNLTDRALRFEVAEVQADSFPSFDLTQLTVRQFNVLVMRYRGDMRWSDIARAEGVSRQAICDRHERALARLQAQNLAF